MTEITPSKCKHCGLPDPSPQGILLTEALAEQVAPLIRELDRLQEEQLKRDTLEYFSQFSSGSRFSSLNGQSYRASSARRQEKMIQLQKQLSEAGYEYHALRFPLEFYITPRYSEKELARYGNPKQSYRAEPGLKDLVSDQTGCKHIVSAPTLLEGSERVLAEHLEKCPASSVAATETENKL